MGYSKDPVKRRRQLEALARNNPRIDVDALLEKHASADPKTPVAEGPQTTAAGGYWWQTQAADGDVIHEDARLSLIFWAAGAEEEHPMLGLPITADAALDLARSIDRILEVEDNRQRDEQGVDEPWPGSGGGFDVETLRVLDMDRPRFSRGEIDGRHPPGQVELVMTAEDGREITARLTGEQVRSLARWLKPGLFDVPRVELEVSAGGGGHGLNRLSGGSGGRELASGARSGRDD